MVSTTIRRIGLQSSAVVTASALFACAMPRALASADLKIRTVQRNSGSPVEMNPRTEERIVYIQGNRTRTEERREQRNALWSGGPRVTFYEPRRALIESCEDDTKRAFSLNLDDRTYAPIVLGRKLTAEEITALKDRVPKAGTPTRPTVLHETTTRDTGERKQSFGYTARHVITTFKIIPLEGTNVMAMETVTDGWYIDLDAHISCDPGQQALREGTTYAVAQLLVDAVPPSQTTAPVSASDPNLVQTRYIGKPETGFPIWVRTTMRYSLPARESKSEQLTTTEIEVTELSAKPLDPGLFEVPRDFRSVTRILPVPQVALWARWLAWGHSYWVRFNERGGRI
jgi:hypothetical protein